MSAPRSGVPAAPRRFQFNLATLLLFMAWIGVSCVALRTPSAAWSGAIFCVTLLALATSALATVYRTQGARAFALGFLVCGLGYATCLFLVEHRFTSQNDPTAELPPTRFAQWLFEKMHTDSVQSVTVPAGGMGGMGGGGIQPLGGGGMYSVDSSEQAVCSDDSEPADEQEADVSTEEAAPGDPGATGMEGGGMGMPMTGSMPAMGGGIGGMGMGGTVTYTVPLYDSTNFVAIVHCTLMVLLSILSGTIARWLYAAGERQPRDPTSVDRSIL